MRETVHVWRQTGEVVGWGWGGKEGGTGPRWSRWLVLPIKAGFSIPIDMHRVDN